MACGDIPKKSLEEQIAEHAGAEIAFRVGGDRFAKLEQGLAEAQATIAAMQEAIVQINETSYMMQCFDERLRQDGVLRAIEHAVGLCNADTAQLAANHDAAIREPLEKKIAALRRGLLAFGSHASRCRMSNGGYPCNCGYTALMSDGEPAKCSAAQPEEAGPQ